MTLVHPEEKRKFEFKLVSLDKQGELERTTVFPNSSKWYRYPTEKLCLIRMMEFSALKERFVPCPIEVAPIWAAYTENGPGPRDWMNYTFDGWGSADMNPLLGLGSSDGGSDSEGSPDLTGFDPEDLVGQYNTPGGAPSVMSGFTGVKDSRGRQPSEAQPRVDGAFNLGSRPPSVDEKAHARSTIGNAVRRPRPRPGKEPAVANDTENYNGQISGYHTEVSSHYKDLASLHFDGVLDDTTNYPSSFRLSRPSSVGTEDSDLGPKSDEKHLGTGIELSARPPPKSNNKFSGFSDRVMEPKETESITTRSVRKVRERNPRSENEASDGSSSRPSEKREEVSEVDTRKIWVTMKQKAPSRRNLHDGADESPKSHTRLITRGV